MKKSVKREEESKATGEGKRGSMLESDLYDPVRDLLTEWGFMVRGEVAHCDIAAVKGDELLIVELKRSLNLDVILQAALRQRMADKVYIAVPKKSRAVYTKRWKNICYLLRRLKIGLILVSFHSKASYAEEAFKPEEFNLELSRKRSERRRRSLLKEFRERHGDYNTGGVTGKKLVTAYKELVIHIAALIEKNGPMSIKELKESGSDEKKTAGILQKNFHRWFKRVSYGVYDLTDIGRNGLDEHRELAEYYLDRNC